MRDDSNWSEIQMNTVKDALHYEDSTLNVAQSRMNVLFIANGIGLIDGVVGVSGGDLRWIEIARQWQKAGYNIHVFTPEAGKKLCEKLKLEAEFHIPNVPNNYSLTTYLFRFFHASSIPKTLHDYKGIIYSTTEHFYDVVPALKLKKRNSANPWAAVVHWVAPLKRIGTSKLNGFLFFLNQRLGFHYIRNGADIVLAISENTTTQVKNVGIKNNVFTVGAGVDYPKARKVASKVKTKRYDAIFMKRFDGTKGVFDIIEIWKDVAKAKKDAKLGMLGLGSRKVMIKLKEMVEAYDIAHSVDFLGPIYDFDAKFLILGSSKLFVLPSYEENWAIVIGEAMGAGVPVVCYDLPGIRHIWKNNVIWVPRGDKCRFAGEVIELLNDENKRLEFAKKGIEFVRKYSWSKIADTEMHLILDSRTQSDLPN